MRVFESGIYLISFKEGMSEEEIKNFTNKLYEENSSKIKGMHFFHVDNKFLEEMDTKIESILKASGKESKEALK